MMNCFPQIYEDELFYSIVARYKRMCGLISKRAVLNDLYNEAVTLESIYFPVHISRVVSNLPPSSKITSDYIIKNNTMFRLYTAFLSKEESLLIYKGMKESKAFNAMQSIGLTSSKIKMYSQLRYCSMCREEHINKTLGESYWSRLFQVPGVLFCPKHHIQLSNSKVFAGNSRVDYTCADQEIILGEDVQDDISKFKDLNFKYIHMVEYLLNNDIDNKKLKYIIDFYIDRLRERGLASKGGSIDMDEFQSGFINYYGNEYLRLMQSEVDVNKETNWLRLFVRNNGKKRNSLRHLLMLQFLDVSIEEIFDETNIKGKLMAQVDFHPRLDRALKRKEWIKFLKDNPDKSKSELKRIAKGLYTWLYRNDREWFDEITPKRKNGAKMGAIKDWDELDKNTLILVKMAVKKLLSSKGKPIRVYNASIRRYLGQGYSFNNKKLIKTNKYITKVTEEIDSYRIRKIKWAIEELIHRDEIVTRYKIQLVAGFGGNCSESIKEFIDKVLGN